MPPRKASEMHTLTVQRLTPATFAPFGTVVQAPPEGGRPINGGSSQRFDLLDDMALSAQGGRPMLALFRAQARQFPHAVNELECHRLGSQSFVPLGRRRFVLVVAPAAPQPDLAAIAAFVTDGEQGVVLAPGTWHHALLAVDAGDFVVVERAADVVDCDVVRWDTPVSVQLA
jgi:ureidoglycolate lyase